MPASRSSLTQVHKLAGSLVLPEPFEVTRLCDLIAAQRRRRIVLTAVPMSAVGPCGLWLASADTDHILFEEHTSVLHQRHIVLHELGHILRRHVSPEALHLSIAELAPSLNPATVRMMLARQHADYRPEQEAEAEAFAYAVLTRVAKRGAPQHGDVHGGFPRRFLDALEG